MVCAHSQAFSRFPAKGKAGTIARTFYHKHGSVQTRMLRQWPMKGEPARSTSSSSLSALSSPDSVCHKASRTVFRWAAKKFRWRPFQDAESDGIAIDPNRATPRKTFSVAESSMESRLAVRAISRVQRTRSITSARPLRLRHRSGACSQGWRSGRHVSIAVPAQSQEPLFELAQWGGFVTLRSNERSRGNSRYS